MKYYITLNDEGEVMSLDLSFHNAEKRILECFEENEEYNKTFRKDSNGDLNITYDSDFVYYEIIQGDINDTIIQGYFDAQKMDEFTKKTRTTDTIARKIYGEDTPVQEMLYCKGWNKFIDDQLLEMEAEKYMKEHENG